ncbi:MAG: hypothetical protein FIB01_08525 [Gemmatimonadetes bacterium]|nr:hypothetical protein [Gemmatimonadota bacterium]
MSFRDDGGGTTRFRARAGHLGNRLVLDVSAQLEKNDAAGLTETLLGTLIPGHMLVVLEPKGDSLRAAMLEQDSLRSALRSGKARTASLDLDGALVLTAPTDSLRAFLAAYLERPGALGDWGKFTRVPAVTPPSGR